MPERTPTATELDAAQAAKRLSQSHLPITQRHYPDIEGCMLAFDFGEKRIGVAVGNTLMQMAHGLTTIAAEDNARKFSEIAALIEAWQPALLVVGHPTHLNGEAHAMTKLAEKFAQRLEGRFAIPVVMVDERLSSAEASQTLKAAGIHGRAQKPMLDQVAAQTILQSYLDARPRNPTAQES